MLEGMWNFCEKENKVFDAIVFDTYNEDFSARKGRKSGNNRTVTIESLYVEYRGRKNM